jgi:FAD/FMN-containing dehydrogenase
MCEPRLQAETLCEMFSAFGARIVVEPLFDFSRLHQGSSAFCEVCPATTEELCGVVRLAAHNRIALRTRGSGHTLNGSSLPRQGELLIRTLSLSNASNPVDGVASIGAGCILWYLERWLGLQGYSLPVLNAGLAGPTVGGFVAAGGFGPGSAVSGGFWDSVSELTVVDGAGQLRVIARGDPLFPWFFGAMGQLGILAEAKLDVTTAATKAAPSTPFPRDEAGRLFWFSLFVPEASLSDACRLLDEIERKHCETFTLLDRYSYLIRHRGIVAPLIWPHASTCYAVGSWGVLDNVSSDRVSRVLAFDTDFMDLASANGYRRYVQSEVPSGAPLYERYFGAEIYERFRALKARLDPYNLLNRDWVFDDG